MNAPCSGDRLGDTKKFLAAAARERGSRSAPELKDTACGEPCQLAEFSVIPLGTAVGEVVDLSVRCSKGGRLEEAGTEAIP